jgi:hypothetical protein
MSPDSFRIARIEKPAFSDVVTPLDAINRNRMPAGFDPVSDAGPDAVVR